MRPLTRREVGTHPRGIHHGSHAVNCGERFMSHEETRVVAGMAVEVKTYPRHQVRKREDQFR